MGKIRIKTLGSEKDEKKEKKKAEARAQAKKAKEDAQKSLQSEQKEEVTELNTQPAASDVEEKQKKTKVKNFADKKLRRTASYMASASLVDKNKEYGLSEALSLLPKLVRAKFDETVELHINTSDKGISGNVVLPHGSGKEVRVVIANADVDPKALEELVKRIESGSIDFDVLIATPDSMPKLARVARVLGPRGLMPNPKNGTISTKPMDVAKNFQGGQINFKTESKFPLMHLAVGKVSFGDKKLEDNVKAIIKAVKPINIKSVTLKATMTPGLRINVASL